MDKLFTCEELADRYSVKIITIYDWIKAGKLKAMKIGRQYRIRKEDILAFEASQNN
ncbi:MAG: helix-turn-helix domain-containing protein [Clostridia bacterium]|nr:helix-turn-helix domain-containing protein [Clostridia bacterium]